MKYRLSLTLLAAIIILGSAGFAISGNDDAPDENSAGEPAEKYAAAAKTEGDYAEVESLIGISGEGKIKAEPEVAHLSLAVITEDDSARAAQEENSQIINRVVNGLEQAGISPDDIEIAQYRIREINREVRPRPGEEVNEETEEAAKYRVTNQIEVTVHELDEAGSILQESVDLGINRVNSVRFSVIDEEEYKLQALEKALEKAETKGKRIAQFYDRALGEVLQVEEGRVSLQRMDFPEAEMLEEREAVGADPLPAQPGEITIEAQVSVKYQLK